MKILEVISWLDNKRWSFSDLNYDISDLKNETFEKLPWENQLLVHWLCYITDRMRPVKQVWTNGGHIFSELVLAYLNNNISSKKDVISLFTHNHGYMKKPDNGWIDNFRSKKDDKITYTVRYTDDLYSIIRTLIILLKYDKNIIKYLEQNKDKWYDRGDDIVRMTFLLHLLSYNKTIEGINTINIKNEQTLLKNISNYEENMLNRFDIKFNNWNNNAKYSCKRLWASIRDYLKLSHFSQYFLPRFNMNYSWPVLNQLEYPGDIWNIRFSEKLLKPIMEGEKINGKKVYIKSNASDSMRRMFTWAKIQDKYYPEQFDISFDFTPNMCDKNNCDLCPFSEGSLQLCIEGKLNEKLCPIVLLACGYRSPCIPNNCPIRARIAENICNSAQQY